jgi:hypothetical protein
MKAMASDLNERTVRNRTPGLLPAERRALSIVAILVLLDAVLVIAGSTTVDIVSFAAPVAVALSLLTIGVAYRVSGRSEPFALALVSFAILTLFSNVGAILNFLVIPVGQPTIDASLAMFDHRLGFDWTAFATAVSSVPFAARALALVYLSSLAQLALVVLFLGMTMRPAELHRFLLCGMVASLFSIAIWCVTPSIGPAAWATLDPLADARLGRVLGDDYALTMRGLLEHGLPSVRADRLIGLIAFPSMHTVMLCMTVWYTRRTRMWLPLLLLNLPMIPAILIHGSHNLADVLGGVAVFTCSSIAAARFAGGNSAAAAAVRRRAAARPNRPALQSA